MLSLLDLEEPYRIISSLVERMGIEYNYVRKVVEEVRKKGLVSIFPNYRKLGITLGLIVTEKNSYPETVLDGLARRFFEGKTIAPKLYNVYVYSFDNSLSKIFLEWIENYDSSASIFLDESKENEVSLYFRDSERLKILAKFCENPMNSLRNIADMLEMPFSSVRYIVNKALAEGILDMSKKIMNEPRGMGIQQLFVLSQFMKEEGDRPEEFLDEISTGEVISRALFKDRLKKMYFVRSFAEYNLYEYISKRFVEPMVLILYKIDIKKMFVSSINVLSSVEKD